MLFPHVDSAEYVELVTTVRKNGKIKLSNVKTECLDGKIYSIRPPFIQRNCIFIYTDKVFLE